MHRHQQGGRKHPVQALGESSVEDDVKVYGYQGRSRPDQRWR